jgi:hypothetical protein
MINAPFRSGFSRSTYLHRRKAVVRNRFGSLNLVSTLSGFPLAGISPKPTGEIENKGVRVFYDSVMFWRAAWLVSR